MKHAGSEAIARLEPLLARLRTREPLREKRPAVQLKSRAFLHFHEDPRGLFADVRLEDFERFAIETSKPQEALWRRNDRFLAAR